jgi:CheY-like chemotaxis protein
MGMSARDPTAARRIGCHNLAPNLILLDLMMPEMDGFKFLSCARDCVLMSLS